MIREHHEETGHTGRQKLMTELQRFYCMRQERTTLAHLVAHILKHCEVCQVYKSQNRNTRTELRGTPVPDTVGDSIALDIFSMQEVVWEGEKFDCFILVVDRHSGCTLVEPAKMKGLTSSKVDQEIIPKWVDIFGTPSVIMSDQDPKFVANWW